MLLFAVDLGEHLGWAQARDRAAPTFGVEHLPKTGDDLGWTAQALDTFLTHRFTHIAKPEIVGYARSVVYGPEQAQAQMKLLGMAMMLEFICQRHDIPIDKEWEGRVRSQYLAPDPVPRKGKDAKEASLARSRALGIDVQDHNAGDALAVLDWLRSRHVKSWPSAAERSGLFAQTGKERQRG